MCLEEVAFELTIEEEDVLGVKQRMQFYVTEDDIYKKKYILRLGVQSMVMDEVQSLLGGEGSESRETLNVN